MKKSVALAVAAALVMALIVALIVATTWGLVRLRTGQLTQQDRASETMAIEIARYRDLLERLDPAGAETLTAPEPSEEDAASLWKRLTSAEQEKVRANYRRWQDTAPAEQRALIERYRRFRSLPSEKQRQLIREQQEREGIRAMSGNGG